MNMPSDQYNLVLTNTTVAKLNRLKSRVTGMVIGDTEIVLNDKSMPLQSAMQSHYCLA